MSYWSFSCREELNLLESEENKETWIITRGAQEENGEKIIPGGKEKRVTPAATRELALGKIADRLGESKTWDQKANNAFVYYSLPTFTSFGMAFEKRANQLVGNVNATITECSCSSNKCKLAGRSVIIEGGIFENTNTLTEWFMNFFQQSPSIGGMARKDQVEIAKAGYATASAHDWSSFGREEQPAEED